MEGPPEPGSRAVIPGKIPHAEMAGTPHGFPGPRGPDKDATSICGPNAADQNQFVNKHRPGRYTRTEGFRVRGETV